MLFCVTFIISLLVSLILVLTNRSHQKFTLDSDLIGVQKFHREPTPRIGGAPVFLGIILGILILQILDSKSIFYTRGIVIPIVIVFLAGFLEDLTKNISPLERTLFFVIALMAGLYATGALNYISYSGFVSFDYYLSHYTSFAALLTFIAVIGLTNAYNIIDGFNGLASITAIFNLLGLAAICYLQSDVEHINALRANNMIGLVGAICGFLIFNYPHAKIFLGDCGAYFIGFVIAILSLKTIEANNGVVSPYAILLLVIYPITEIGFSIFRRKFLSKSNATAPDAIHFHTLIYKRCTNFNSKFRNPSVVILMLIMIVPQSILAVVFYKSNLICLLLSLVYICIYVYFYFSIILFRTNFIFKFLLGRK